MYDDRIVVSEAGEGAWERFVCQRDEATGYHRWAWRRVIERAFGHETVYLAATRADEVVGVLPLVLFKTGIFGRFISSLPFVNYGGVLTRDDEAAEALLRRATEIAREERMSYIELRHAASRYPTLPSRSHKVTMLLQLPGNPDAMWSRVDRKARNQVRKAEKSDLTFASGGSELLADFYDVFSTNMRDLGTPVYSSRFFDEVLAAFPDEASVQVVRHGVRPVAGALSYAHGGVYEVPWASSLRAERARCPNYLLYWASIQRAIQLGCTLFDFGRSTPNEGTFNFKQQWDAKPHPLCWEYRLVGRATLPDQSPSNPKYRAAIALWKKLPVPVTRLIGPSIVRRIA